MEIKANIYCQIFMIDLCEIYNDGFVSQSEIGISVIEPSMAMTRLLVDRHQNTELN